MRRNEIISLLKENDQQEIERLFAKADRARASQVGPQVHLRALLEISSHCRRDCAYCGLRASNRNLKRYRMRSRAIIAAAERGAQLGYGTVVLQAGEDLGLRRARISSLIRRIRTETGMAVTLSLGERSAADLAAWREAGALRYLLRFETSDQRLLRSVHPPLRSNHEPHPRLALLSLLRELGYETGGGVMVGLPGQSYGTLADDILTFGSLELDMTGVGPWVPHPDTPLGKTGFPDNPEQVPNSAEMTLKVIALARLARPTSNIPATTALATVGGENLLAKALSCGANVIMPDMTPPRFREGYSIYPGKSGFFQQAASQDKELKKVIVSIGRTVGVGAGNSPSYEHRRTQQPAAAAGGL